jgi:Icc-related predicted phosphoesterase
MKLAWATDIHLNFCSRRRAQKFLRKLADAGADAILLGGDIAEAPELEDWLAAIESAISAPAYFVLGNHDYYGAEVAALESLMQRRVSRGLSWLPAAGVIPLTRRTALVGSGGDRAADELRPLLFDAAQTFEQVLVLTHVPPFPEMSWHRGHPADEAALPNFSCRAFGDLILEVAGAHPHCRLTVLSGHTHHDAVATLCWTSSRETAAFGHPRRQRRRSDQAVF